MPNTSDGIIPESLVKASTDIATVSSGTHTVAADEVYIMVDYTATGAVTVTLPAGADHYGRVIVKDRGGNASVNNITVNPDGAETIDGVTGAGSLILSGNYVAVTLQFNATEWSIV